MALDRETRFDYLIRQADSNMVLGHRMSEWIGKAPTIEEELALANISLDLIGLARALYIHANGVAGDGRDEDQLVYLRDAHEFRNLLLVEKRNGDFALTIVRQFLYSAFANLYWKVLSDTGDEDLAGIASKATYESAYHLRHASEWLIRLGDGTKESHDRAQAALDELWMYTGEMFEMDETDQAALGDGTGVDAGSLRAEWSATVDEILTRATLTRPADGWMIGGGRDGKHTEHLGHMLSDMQFLQRAYPGQQW